MIVRRALLGGLAAPFVLRPAFGAGLNLIVGAPTGTSVDLQARAFAPFLERYFAHGRVAVRNRPGLGGLVAYRTVADASAEGATLGWVATPALPARSLDLPEGAGVLDRLLLIGAVQSEVLCLVTLPGKPVLSGTDLLRRAADDTAAFPLGTAASGSPSHLAALRLQEATGRSLRIVAFPSSAAALQAALSGTVSASVLAQSDAAASLRGGQLTGFALSADGETDPVPPSLAGALSPLGLPVRLGIQRGLAAPIAMAEAHAAPIAAALATIAADPDYQAQGETIGFEASFLSGPDWSRRTRTQHSEFDRIWRASPWTSPARP